MKERIEIKRADVIANIADVRDAIFDALRGCNRVAAEMREGEPPRSLVGGLLRTYKDLETASLRVRNLMALLADMPNAVWEGE